MIGDKETCIYSANGTGMIQRCLLFKQRKAAVRLKGEQLIVYFMQTGKRLMTTDKQGLAKCRILDSSDDLDAAEMQTSGQESTQG